MEKQWSWKPGHREGAAERTLDIMETFVGRMQPVLMDHREVAGNKHTENKHTGNNPSLCC